MLGNQTGTWCVPVPIPLTESSPKEAWLPAALATTKLNEKYLYSLNSTNNRTLYHL